MVPRRAVHRLAGSSDKPDARSGIATVRDVEVIDLKRRIATMTRLIAEFNRLAANLDREVRNEEHRVKIHDPADVAYSNYAQTAALRRDNLRRSAVELRAELAIAKKTLLGLDEI